MRAEVAEMPTTGLPPDQVLDAALQAFISAMQGYFPLLLFWGMAILSAVVFCGLAYALLMAIANHDWFGMLMGMAYAFARVMVIYMLYENFESIGSIFPTMGQTVGFSVSNVSDTPSDIYSMGLTIVGLLFSNRHWGAWFNLVADGEFLLLIVLTMLVWFAIAIRYLFIQVETEWIFIKGAVTVCFAAFPNTFVTLENWAVQMIKVGIRLIAVMLIIAIGISLAEDWTNTLRALGVTLNVNPVAYGAVQLSEAFLVLWAVWSLPQKADALIASSGGSNSAMGEESGKGVFDATTDAIASGAKALVA
jgi:TrbL/VirB6 plasmid conjugal transfer protein